MASPKAKALAQVGKRFAGGVTGDRRAGFSGGVRGDTQRFGPGIRGDKPIPKPAAKPTGKGTGGGPKGPSVTPALTPEQQTKLSGYDYQYGLNMAAEGRKVTDAQAQYGFFDANGVYHPVGMQNAAAQHLHDLNANLQNQAAAARGLGFSSINAGALNDIDAHLATTNNLLQTNLARIQTDAGAAMDRLTGAYTVTHALANIQKVQNAENQTPVQGGGSGTANSSGAPSTPGFSGGTTHPDQLQPGFGPGTPNPDRAAGFGPGAPRPDQLAPKPPAPSAPNMRWGGV